MQNLESIWKTMWGKNLEPTHTRKMYETVKRVSRNSQKQKMNYLVLQRKGTAVKRLRE